MKKKVFDKSDEVKDVAKEIGYGLKTPPPKKKANVPSLPDTEYEEDTGLRKNKAGDARHRMGVQSKAKKEGRNVIRPDSSVDDVYEAEFPTKKGNVAERLNKAAAKAVKKVNRT